MTRSMRAPTVSSKANLLAALATLVLSGCAGNPYRSAVPLPRPPAPAPSEKPSVSAAQSMAWSVAYADALAQSYRQQQSDEFDRQQVLSTGLITLGAATLGLAVGKARPNVFAGTAIAAGYTYELGTWNTNTGRIGIFAQGEKALYCATAAVGALRMSSTQLDAINVSAAATNEALKEGASASSETVRLLIIVGTSSPDATKAAQSELAQFNALATKVNDSLSRASGMDHRVQQASAQVEGTVNNIRASVDAALGGTLADLANLPKFIGDLTTYANAIVPQGLPASTHIASTAAPSTPAMKTPNAQSGSPDSIELAKAVGLLAAARMQLTAADSVLEGQLEPMSVQDLQASLNGCGVDTSKFGTTMKLSATTATFTSDAPMATKFTVSGGTDPIDWYLQEHLAENGLDVTTAPGNHAYVLTATAKTVAMDYHLVIHDATGASAVFTATVAKAAPVADVKPDNGTGSSETASVASTCPGSDATRPMEKVCLVQWALGAKADGKFGTKSCKALTNTPLGTNNAKGMFNDNTVAAAVAKAGLAPDADTAAIHAKLVELGAPCVQAAATSTTSSTSKTDTSQSPVCAATQTQSPFECQMSASQVSGLRTKLGLSPTPVSFDGEMRKRLADQAKSANLAVQTGEFTSELAAFLQSPNH